MSVILEKPCPKCKSSKSVQINGANLSCQNSECAFKIEVPCPLCNASLSDATFKQSDYFQTTQCTSCNNVITTKKLKHLIDNGLHVDTNHRCDTCNGPTVHKAQMNITNRCFYFPACADQGQLFGGPKESLVFLDFETTGLEIGRDAIIEFGALKIDEDGDEHSFQRFVSPNRPLPAKIVQITGITDAMLEGAPDLEPVIDEFLEFLGHSTLVCHNADFDIPWLVTASLRLNRPIQTKNVICTMNWAKNSQESRYGLGALTKKYNIGHANAHRALADAVATKEIYFILSNKKVSPRPLKPLSDYRALSKRLVERYSTPQQV
ncbi:MAG: 3'-5' exonuclease [bacterium]|nr:3'-5' exonuclease [bacterium]